MSLLHNLYQFLTILLSPFMKLFIVMRALRGREDKSRLDERWGIPSLMKRPKGQVYWIHAVSVGEANSALVLVKLLQQLDPQAKILMTTGTKTSAHLMAERLPQGAIHQYFPIDTPFAVRSFLDFWEPNLVLWVESEIWPNMLMEIKKRRIPLLSMNGRMSTRSYKRWRSVLPFIRPLMRAFTWCGVQTVQARDMFLTLGATSVDVMPNLKLLVDSPKYSQKDYESFKDALGHRLVWFASCTHLGEEDELIRTHKLLLETSPDALLFLAPRHINRIGKIRTTLDKAGLSYEVRSHESLPGTKVNVYLIDSMGELSLFYKLSPLTFMGGTWVPKGGHNPIEAAQAGSFVFHGPFTASNQTLYEVLSSLELGLHVKDASELCSQLIKGKKCGTPSWEDVRESGLDDLREVLSKYVGKRMEAAC